MVFYVFLCRSVCWFVNGPFWNGALKLNLSTLFTTIFLRTSLQFIVHLNLIMFLTIRVCMLLQSNVNWKKYTVCSIWWNNTCILCLQYYNITPISVTSNERLPLSADKTITPAQNIDHKKWTSRATSQEQRKSYVSALCCSTEVI